MAELKAELVTLRGELAAWRFIGSDSWGTGTLRQDSGPVPVVGTLLGARVGDHVELTGHWHEHPRFGRQFKFRSVTAALPQTSAGVVAWLVTTLPGVGQKRAQALVDTFGDALWHVVETEPDRLTEIPGITAAGAQRVRAAYMEHRDDRDSMVALRGWGLTDNQIKHCKKAWGTLASIVDHVRANPYELCHHVFGFGFKRADQVAAKVGVPSDAPERISAGVEHVLDLAQQAGHCWVAGRQLQHESAKLLGCDLKQAVRGIRDACAAKRVVEINMRFYPVHLARAEEQSARYVRDFL